MSATDNPMAFRWHVDGNTQQGVMFPLRPQSAAKRYVHLQEYVFVEHHDRSWESHAHEFAWLKTAWANLPEDLAEQFPTPTHLRKRALIEAGFYNEEIIDCGSEAGALRVAAMFRKREEFTIVIVRGVFVFLREPKSQSYRAMGKRDFQASKQAVLEVVANLIGVPVEALRKNAGQAA